MKCLRCLLPVESTQVYYGLHAQCFMTWFGVPQMTPFVGLTRHAVSVSASLASNSVPIHKASENFSFFHGRFKKYSGELEGTSYILKMREREAPELPEVEYLCNQIGKLLNIPVAEFYLIDFEGDRVFVTKNFIKSNIPMDLQHIYHFRSEHEHSCAGLIRIVSEKTQQLYDVKALIQTILFDALIGNHDRHGRNLAFVVTAGKTALAPIYDNVSYLGLEQGAMLKADFNPTGKIQTDISREPSMKEYVKELVSLGYQGIVESFYQTIKMAQIERLIQESFCSIDMQEAMMRLVSKRYKEMGDELKS